MKRLWYIDSSFLEDIVLELDGYGIVVTDSELLHDTLKGLNLITDGEVLATEEKENQNDHA